MTKLYEKLFKSCPSDGEIKKGLKKIYTGISGTHDRKTLMDILGAIDLTSLNTTDNKSSILQLTGKINSFSARYTNIPCVAAICVYPNFVPLVKEKLKARNVKIAAVAGGFPTSQTFKSIKIAECKMATDAGADEIDFIFNVGAFLGNDYQTVAEEIREIKSAIGNSTLKVIIETGLLNSYELIFNASMIAMDAGADFIKTSTGKISVSATPEFVFVICRAISVFYNETGIRVGIKPSGGIAISKDAMVYYNIIKTILGPEWLNPSFFRIGSSRLANDVLSEIIGSRADYF